MELVEPRRMMTASVTSSSGDSYSDIMGTYFGSVMFGDDGYADGVPTAGAGTGDQATVCSYTTWDSDPDDGIDSGFVGFRLGINTDGMGGGTLGVSNAATSTFSADQTGGIHSITIQADSGGAYMQMEWQNVTVSFYSGGQLMETVNVGSISAGSLDGTTYDPSEKLITITTNATDYDGVSVTGQVRLTAAQGTYPSATDLFGKVTIS